MIRSRLSSQLMSMLGVVGVLAGLVGAVAICALQEKGADLAMNAALAYVRYEPLSAQQVPELQADRRRTDCRRIIATHDGDFDLRVHAVPGTHQERLYPNGVPCHMLHWPY